MDFTETTLRYINFKDTNLKDLVFTGADAMKSDFTKIKDKTLSGSDLSFASFTFADFSDIKISDSILFWANFYSADMSGVDFTENSVPIEGTIFQKTNLSNANFENVNISPVEFKSYIFTDKANYNTKSLPEIRSLFNWANYNNIFILNWEPVGNDLDVTFVYFNNFSEANLENANLKNADLRFVNFSKTNLKNADLSGSDLTWTSFKDADLEGANLEGVKLERTNLDCYNHEICN